METARTTALATASKKVEDLRVGDVVDLANSPSGWRASSAASAYGAVVAMSRDSEASVLVEYQGMDTIGYPVGTELQVVLPREVPDPAIQVRLPQAPEDWTVWHISQNLTDRWGELNLHNALNKPLDPLILDEALFSRLQAQMTDETTFVVRKDGQYGLLFEVEYCSQESEARDDEQDPQWRPHQVVIAALAAGLCKLEPRFPGVQFALPHESEMVNERPCVWAFMPEGLLNGQQRQELSDGLHSL